MKKIISILLMSVIITVGMAQKTVNTQQPKHNTSGKIVKLVETLEVYPEDLGYLTCQEAEEICVKINAQKMHGHNDWRLPSQDELSMIYRNKDKINGLVEGYYLSSEQMINEYGKTIGYAVFDMTLGNRQWRRADGQFDNYMPVDEKANIRLVRNDIRH